MKTFMDVKMAGFDNEGLEKKENVSQLRSEDLEVNEERTDGITVSVGDPVLKVDDEESKGSNENIIVRWNLKTRAYLGGLIFGKGRSSGIFRSFFVNSAAVLILIASIVQFVSNFSDSSEIDWCNGVGFLWILYCLVYISFLYHLINKFYGKSISACFKPLSDCFSSFGTTKYFRGFCYIIPVLALAVYVFVSPGKSGRRKYSFLGMIVFVVLGYIFSKYPAHVNWRPVICGLALQFAFGIFTIQFETGKNILNCLGQKVTGFLQNTEKGASFVFGFLAESNDDFIPIFAFSVLPVIYFLCFFINLLSYYGALQWFIMKISSIVRIAMGTTVCESVNAAASIFLGMTEAPLLIQSYLKDLTKSEICAILCAGWSTVAGVVMAAYIQFGVKASHLIAASVMSAPASLSYSKLLYPETEESKTTTDNIVLYREEASNALDAASKGAMSGILIIGSIIANIIAVLAFVAFLDETLIWTGAITGFKELSFQFVMSKIFYPISFLMGVEEDSLESVAYLIGIKTIANEFQAYYKLGELIKADQISERSEIIATYALCGFSNFGSLGITIGTLSAIEPRQTSTITEVALTAFIAANIVCCLTACVAGENKLSVIVFLTIIKRPVEEETF